VPIVLKSGSLNLLEPSGPVQACNGIALPLYDISSLSVNTKEESTQFSTLVTNTLAKSVLLTGEIAVCSEIYTKHINTLCGDSVEILLTLNLAVRIVTTELEKNERYGSECQ